MRRVLCPATDASSFRSPERTAHLNEVLPEVGFICVQLIAQISVVNLVHHLAPPLHQRQVEVARKGLQLVEIHGVAFDVAENP